MNRSLFVITRTDSKTFVIHRDFTDSRAIIRAKSAARSSVFHAFLRVLCIVSLFSSLRNINKFTNTIIENTMNVTIHTMTIGNVTRPLSLMTAIQQPDGIEVNTIPTRMSHHVSEASIVCNTSREFKNNTRLSLIERVPMRSPRNEIARDRVVIAFGNRAVFIRIDLFGAFNKRGEHSRIARYVRHINIESREFLFAQWCAAHARIRAIRR